MADITTRIESLSPAKRKLLEQSLSRNGRKTYPLSFAQQRLWLIDQLGSGSIAYNLPRVLRLQGSLNKVALRRTLNEIVRRHEALRTTFIELNGKPMQLVAAKLELPLVEIDLSSAPESERQEQLAAMVQAESVAPFDLRQGPLVRARLWTLNARDYVLLVNMHHIVSDAWSTSIMVREFSQLYQAFAEGRESPLPELAMQYGDFAVWQRQWLQGEVLEKQMGYWREELEGVPVLELPTDYARSARVSQRGGRVSFQLDQQLSRLLKEFSRQQNVTLFMSLMAAFQLVLGRHAGQRDVVVGTPIANRNRVETEGLIGFFVNTLVVRTRLEEELSFGQLLEQVRKTVLAAYEHQDLPFEKLVEELGSQRESGRSPLFQVLLALQNTEQEQAELAGLNVSGFHSRDEQVDAKFELYLVLKESTAGVGGELTYARDLYDERTALHLLEHLRVVLASVVAAPEQRISEISLLSEAERRRLLEEINPRTTEPVRQCVHRLFEEQVERRPGAVAVVHEGREVSYRELNRRANQLAHYLQKLHVGPEVRVALCLERSVELVVALLGILKAGGAYVPLDPAYPGDRLAYMLEDAEAPALVTQKSLVSRLPQHMAGVRVVCLDEEWPEIERGSVEDPDVEMGPENLAYVIYTSGSTGQPKGTEVPHRSIFGFMLNVDYARFDEDAVQLQHSSLSWDVPTLELWPALLKGGRCVLSSLPMITPEALRHYVQEQGVNMLWLTSSLFNSVVDTDAESLVGIRDLMIGGEAISAGHVRRVQEKVPEMRIVNGYGPSECTVFSTCYVIPNPLPSAVGRVSIGRPIGDRRVYVLDERMNPLPVGAKGELYVGGAGVGRGYRQRPELTAEKFVPDGFGGEAGGRLYRTGDLVNWDWEGKLEFQGRADQQVKIRGYRVELGEIEAVLGRGAGVKQCVVVMREDEEGEKRLVGYVAVAEGEGSEERLREYLRERMPEYMVPARVVVLEELPLMATGKVDRKALPAPEYGKNKDARGSRPRTALEEILVGIWCEVLNLEQAGIHDSFFDLGGHSLLATQVMSRVRSVVGVELPLRVLFESPTVAELAERIEEEKRSRSGGEARMKMERVSREQELPLSFAQQRLWFIDQLMPGSAVYNIPFGIRLKGKLNEEAVQWTVNEIVRRHEVLRTSYPSERGVPVQKINESPEVGWLEIDLRELPEAAREAEAARLAKEDAGTSFDLGRGPLLRSTLLRMGEEEHVLLVNMHHIVSDAWSTGIMMREFSQLYEAFVQGRPSPLEELAVQYADFAVWQRKWLQGEVLEKQLEYWREELAGVPVLELPTDYARSAHVSQHGGRVSFQLDQQLSRQLKEFSRRHNVTLFMSLMAAFQLVLARHAGQRDVAVGTPIANRNRVETEGLIGFFVNTLVVRTELDEGSSFAQLLEQLRKTVLSAYEHQDIPFEKLVEELGTQRESGRSPLFQALLSLHNTEQEQAQLEGLKIGRFDSGHEQVEAKFELYLVLKESVAGIGGELTYASDLYVAESIARLLEHTRVVLAEMVAAPEQKISEVTLLSAEERRQVVEEWNRTEMECPKRCVQELFEEQVERTPEAVAVECEGRQVNYRELNERANQVAHYLRERGVGREVKVGISVERSVELVAGLLAILKAGGAYVPLDPQHPRERVSYMMEDAGITVLLTGEELSEQSEVLRTQSRSNPGVMSQPEDLAYVLYTSGSSGRPKGVEIEHRALMNYLWWALKVYGGKEGAGSERLDFPLYSSISFDLTVTSMFAPLISGGCIYVYGSGGERQDVIGRVLAEDKAATVKLTPSHLSSVGKIENRRLKQLILGGEALSGQLARQTAEQADNPLILWNEYGPTETTVGCVLYRYAGEAKKGEGGRERLHVPVGKPGGNVQIYILDEKQEIAGIGVVGEIYIGGAGLARGYVKRAEMTAERFVPDGYSGKVGARLYRTGDRGRYLEDGNIEYLGRRDEQVKFHGYRVELNEIRTVLNRCEGVRESVVVVERDESGQEFMVAYYAARAEQSGKQLREHMEKWLVRETVPNYFVHLMRIPLTLNGKVNYKGLPGLKEVREKVVKGMKQVKARTPLEEVVAGIWEQVLRLGQVGVEDNFFELGGHSLLATQVMSRVRSVVGVELPLRVLFESPTVAGLAERIEEEKRSRSGGDARMKMERVSREQELPLSFAQQRLWFIDQLMPGSAVYNIPFGIRLKGKLNEEAVQWSVNEIVRRHEVLRTSFPSEHGLALQRIAAAAQIELIQVDLRGIEEEEREIEARRLAEEEAGTAFDLSRGPLLRIKLLRLGEEDHVLLLNMHHIVSDAWSVGIMVREFSQLYQAFVQGNPLPLQELAMQYADFAVWQKNWLQGEVLEQQLEYWREELAGVPVLELPADHRCQARTGKGAVVGVRMSQELTSRLEACSREQGVTTFMGLLASLQLLLGRYANQKDVAVGTVIANRTRLEVEPLIGFFVNTLVLRSRLKAGTFTQLLAQVRRTVLDAYAHQDLPFERLVEDLAPERTPGQTPLFQVSLVLQNVEQEHFALPGLAISRWGGETSWTKFDLTFALSRRDDRLEGMLLYAAEVFAPERMEQLARHWVELLERLLDHPNLLLSDAGLLSATERRQLLEERNPLPAKAITQCVHQMFEEQVKRKPEAAAIVFEGREVSYRELNRRANQLAHYLQRLHVGPEVRVALCLERSVEVVIALLGILKAGGAYVPLDPAYPVERLAYMLEDAEVTVLLTQKNLVNRLPQNMVGARVVCLEQEWQAMECCSGENPDVEIGPENLAYVIYTSGSTGQPKGTEVPHRSIFGFMLDVEYARFDEDAVQLQHSSLSWDVPTLELWPALVKGGRCVLSSWAMITPEALRSYVTGQGVNTLWLTSSLFNSIVDTDAESLEGIRDLMIGGEAISVGHVQRLREKVPGMRMVNGYGPSECTVFSTCYVIPESLLGGVESISIGQPIGDRRVYVLDEWMNPVPIGVKGELYVGGPGVGRGYRKRAEMTAEKFVPDPFGGEAGGRLYRTGDLVSWDWEGKLEFQGRADQQVKIRGFRVELGEIEAVLGRTEGVKQCAVVMREDELGEKRLVAYVSGVGSEEQLREYLRERMPEYMVPARVVKLEDLPLTATGKVDRKALLAVELGSQQRAEGTRPRTAVEEILVGIWCEVLKIERIGINDSFFDLGGHSLLATRIMSRVQSVFQVELPLRTLFEWPTVVELAEQIEQKKREHSDGEEPPKIERVSREQKLPLSFAQQRLWFIDQLTPGSAAYNVPFGIRLTGKLNPQAVQGAVVEIVDRHEVLRTSFPSESGVPVQKIQDHPNVGWSEVDLRGMETSTSAAEAARLAKEDAGVPFDLSHGPLLRVKLLRMGEEDHVLLVNMHHIVSDGWSVAIMVREFSLLYEAFAQGHSSPLEKLAVQYADFAVWQRNWLQGAVLEKQMEYWKKELANLPVLELPTDYPRPPVESNRGNLVEFHLQAAEGQKLYELSRREGATLFMTLLAAFQTLLARYTGQEIIPVGTDIANRNHRETEGLIGFFVNQLVLRGDLSGDPDFRNILGNARSTTLSAYEHQDVPFEQIVEYLQPERHMERAPLFPVNLVLQNTPVNALRLSDLTITSFSGANRVAKLDLEMTISEEASGALRGFLVYSADLFHHNTAERLARYFQQILITAAENPGQRLSEMPLLTAAEHSQLLAECRGRVVALPEQYVQQLFEQQAERTPQAVAVQRDDQTLTYAELNRRTNQLAHYLVKSGVGPEARVGVHIERSSQLLVALLGILKARAAYIALDPGYPAERLRFMIEDSTPRIILYSGVQLPPELSGEARLISLDEQWPEIARGSTTNPEASVRSHDLAYVMYTSGSTGKPKGVMIEHGGLLNHLSAKIADLQITPQDVVAQNAPSSFDISIWQFLAALIAGARVHIMNDEISHDAFMMLKDVEVSGVTVLETVPTMLSLMMAEQERYGAVPLSKLRWLVSNAEALPSGLCTDWLIHYPSAALLNTYGATECSDDTCHVHIAQALPEGLPYAPLGVPIMNTSIYVLDRWQQPSPHGVPGELYIGGDCMGRGYLNQPRLTAEKFIPDPFAQKEGMRLYRTGDLGRWRGDGILEFLGRVDLQVKIRGHRIELGEIEDALLEHPGVQQAVVAVAEDGEKHLAAYLILTAENEVLETEELRNHLQSRLPEYMIPSSFTALKAFPLNANGKVDRKALPEPTNLPAPADASPGCLEEELCAGIFCEVLRRERVGLNGNFFELGGHSLLATQVISRVRNVFKIELPLRALFEDPTVAKLAQRVRLARGNSAVMAPPMIQASREGKLPLSFAQQRLWFIDQLEPGSAAYNIPSAVRLKGELDQAAWWRSVHEIVRRHEVLRTSFPVVNGQALQEIKDQPELAIEKIDLSEYRSSEREAEMHRLVRLEAGTPFNLAQGPMLRMKLLVLAQDEYVVLMTMHHIVGDGWSTGIFVQELVRLYTAYCQGQPSPLPELEIQYADFAVWQRQWMQGDVLAAHLDYWKGRMAGAPVLELPTDRPRPSLPSRRGARELLQAPSELRAQLETISRRAGTTFYMTLLAAFHALLGRYAAQSDVVVGAPIAGRNYAETEPLIGMFFNVLALRVDLSDDPGFMELLARIREITLGAYAHQELPFERLVTELNLERNLTYSPLVQVIFEMNNTPQHAFTLPHLQIEPLPVEVETAKVDMTLSMSDRPEGLFGTLGYNTDLFDSGTMARLVGHYKTFLLHAASDPQRRISQISLLSDLEREQILQEWNGTDVQYPRDLCMHELFENQSRKTPGNVAVVFGDRQLTYHELDCHSNQVAHYLKKRGVGTEARVGICVQRSPEMVIGLLGILKAGAAYVPLDPTYPAERLAYMLNDAQAAAVLTQERLLDKLDAPQAIVICLDTEWQAIEQEPSTALPRTAIADNLAYIYYTSGSTGRPKGVAMAHAGIVNYILWGIEGYAAAAGRGAAVHSSIAVDLTLTNFLPLFVGQRMVLVPEGPGVEELLNVLKSGPDFSLLKLTPTHLTLLNPDLSPEEMSRCTRVLVIGADNLVAEPTLVWRDKVPQVVLLNEYGPTETVVGCSIYHIQEASPRAGGIPIGKPVANITMYVLDSHGELLPAGVPGELYIGGIGVARGYWGRPELTAEKFVPDPFSRVPGARFYRTGDRAKFLPDGNIEFLGRVDHQVKIRGYRIEPGEIEAALSGAPGVHKAMVVVRQDKPGEKRLVAYVAVPEDHVEAGELRSYLKSRLPEYMVPAAFVIMKALPVRASGKIDPKDLPAPEMAADMKDYVEPQTEVQKTLARIWSEVLQVPQVGIHDNFFELGGDSIISIHMVTRAREAGIHLTPRQLFQWQTIAGLAEVVGTGSREIQAEQGTLTGNVRLTPVQEIFFEWDLAKPHHFNQAVVLALHADVDSLHLEQAIMAVLQHHDVLRMKYAHSGQGWTQSYESALPEGVYERKQLADADLKHQELEFERHAALAQASLDLGAGRLIKVLEYDFGEKQRRLLFIIHHLVADGVSWRILLSDLERAYLQLRQGENVSLGNKTTSYRQWAERLRAYSQTDELKQEAVYWAALRAHGTTPLPRDHQAEAHYGLIENEKNAAIWMEEEETRALLQDVPAIYHTQINDVLLTVLGKVFAEWSESKSVLVNVEGHGREEIFDDVDLSRTVGWFTSIYPVLLEVDGAQQWQYDTAVIRTKENLRAIPNRGLGYGVLRYLSEDEEICEQFAEMPQPEISFNYLGQVDQVFKGSKLFDISGGHAGKLIASENRRPHLIDVQGIVVRGRLQINFIYSEDRHSRATIQHRLVRFVECLRDLIAYCRKEKSGGYSPSDFPLTSLTDTDLMQLETLLDE